MQKLEAARREAAARVELARLDAEQHHKESERIQKKAQMRSDAREKAQSAKDAAKKREEDRIQREIEELKQQQQLAEGAIQVTHWPQAKGKCLSQSGERKSMAAIE